MASRSALRPSPLALPKKTEKSLLQDPGQKVLSNQQSFLPFAQLLLWVSASTVPGDVHTLSLILTKPPGVGTVLLIRMGKGSETIISQALSASGFGFAGTQT